MKTYECQSGHIAGYIGNSRTQRTLLCLNGRKMDTETCAYVFILRQRNNKMSPQFRSSWSSTTLDTKLPAATGTTSKTVSPYVSRTKVEAHFKPREPLPRQHTARMSSISLTGRELPASSRFSASIAVRKRQSLAPKRAVTDTIVGLIQPRRNQPEMSDYRL